MIERIESNEMDTRLVYQTWGGILSHNEKAVLGILSLIPKAKTSIDRLMRTITIHAWLRRQDHNGATLMRAIDGEGEPIGQEDEPALGIELTSLDYGAKLEHRSLRSTHIIEPSHPQALDENHFWMECASISPEIESDLIEATRDQYDRWNTRIWEANLAWIQNAHTPMLSYVCVETTKGKQFFECLQEYIEFKRMQANGGTQSWKAFVSERIALDEDEHVLFIRGAGAPLFCWASQARLAKMVARQINENTVDLKEKRAKPGARL